MSEVVGEAVIKVKTDESGVDIDGAGKRAGTGYTRGFLGGIKGLALGIGGVIAAAGAVNFLKGSIAEAREAQKVGAASTQIIKATGGAANITANQLGNLTTAISLKSGVDDEAIQTGSNLILTFKQVRNEVGKGNDIFNQATQAAVDLSAAGFGSIESASKTMGKALNDPTKGMTALTRAGVTFTQSQQDQIKALQASGDLLGAQKIILGEVQGQVGGVAAATATAGEKASVAWGNVKETVGTLLLPILDRLAGVFTSRIAPAITNLVNGTGRLSPVMAVLGQAVHVAFGAFAQILPVILSVADAIRDRVAAALPQIMDAVAGAQPVIATFFGQLQTAVQNVTPIITSLVGEFLSLLPTVIAVATTIASALGPALVAVTGFLGEHATTVKAVAVAIGSMVLVYKVAQVATQAFAAVQAVLNVILDANPIGIVVLALAGLVAGLIYAYTHSERFRAVVDAVFSFLKNAVPAAIDFIVGFVRDHWGLLVSIIGGPLGIIAVQVIKHFGAIKDTVTTIVSFVVNGVKGIVQAVAAIPGQIVNLGGKFLNAGKSIIGSLLDGLKAIGSGAGGIAESVGSAIRGVINGMIDRLNSLLQFSFNTHVPGLGTITIDPPNIGHLATGTDNWRGGMTWVGERGPELVNLPEGAKVLTAAQSRQAAPGIDYTALADALAKAGFGRSVTIAPVLPTGDPEAAAMSVLNRLAAAGAV